MQGPHNEGLLAGKRGEKREGIREVTGNVEAMGKSSESEIKRKENWQDLF